ncbi:MAG TPA: hypothetical protein VM432_05070 [Bdellovibrionales bacterium]|nr:hypothetical protein [Bdellovibrionales bacterium]
MKRQAVLLVTAFAFSSSSFAAIRGIASVETRPEVKPAVSSNQPSGGKKSFCTNAESGTISKANYILPSGEGKSDVRSALVKQTAI